MKKTILIRNLIFLGMFMLYGAMNAQSIKGTISDVNGPLPGANIIVKGTVTGTTSDFDGLYNLNDIDSDAVLVFSFIGYITQEVSIDGQTTIDVTLLEDSNALDEVIIIGYGTQKVSKISGAVSSVNQKTIEMIQPIRAEEALQGQAAGVNVITSGSPGAKPTVLIRGIPSYTGTDPLVVIDGVTQTLDDLNALNSADIESMNVLKDAALTAIYGVSGGNGVIVIKTKSGRGQTKTTYNFDAYSGVQEVVKTIPVLNASEYGAILNEASVVAGGDLIFPDISQLGKGTDWQNEVIENAPITSVNFSASGGGKATSYFISAGYLAQDGVIGGGDKSYFDRANMTANFTTYLNERFTFIVNTSYANIKTGNLSENNIGSVLSNALNFDPTISPFDVNGGFGTSSTITQEIINPLAQIDNTYNEGNTNKLFGKLELQYEIIDDFKLTSRFGYVYSDIYSKNFFPLVYYGAGHNATNANSDLSPIVTIDKDGVETSTHNRVSESKTNYFNYTFELYGNYDFTIKDNHNFQTVLGLSIGKGTGGNITANAQDIPFNSWDYADVSAATGTAAQQTASSWQYEKRNMSYFARINYDYQGKYLVSFTGRMDGSTSFGKNNKFAFFPSASLGWVISNEDFFQSNIFDFLKIRGSIGTVGNDNINPQFAKISTFPKYTYNGVISSGSTLESIPNEDVTWENQVQTNIGFDLRILDNRISLTADYFEKIVDDLLFDPTLSLYLGTPVYPSSNIGKTRSYGIDFSLGYNDTYGENFNFNTNINFTAAKNNVEEINNGDKFIEGGGYGIPWTIVTRFEEGFAPGYFFGYKTDGLFQNQGEIDAHADQSGAQPGDIRYVDVNNDGTINGEDRTEIGNPFPDFTIGWNVGFDYKNIDFLVFTYASVGADMYRAYERNLNYTNRFAGTLDRWTGEGTSNNEPRVTFVDTNNNRRASDRYIEDGSFVKIKNIQFGYSLPESFYNKSGLTKVRFYGQVKNAITFTNYSGYDPEISSGVLDTGIDRGYYPQPRIWSLGVNVKF